MTQSLAVFSRQIHPTCSMMPVRPAETPSRAKYTGKSTIPTSPELQVSRRAELRKASFDLEEQDSGLPDTPTENSSDPVWPLPGGTRPRSPKFSLSRRRLNGEFEKQTEKPAQKPASASESWPNCGLTNPRAPALSEPRAKAEDARTKSVSVIRKGTQPPTGKGFSSKPGPNVAPWSRPPPTRPQSPNFSTRRNPRKLQSATQVPSPRKPRGPALSAEERDAMFERLSRPRTSHLESGSSGRFNNVDAKQEYTGQRTVVEEFNLSVTRSVRNLHKEGGDTDHEAQPQTSLQQKVKEYDPSARTQLKPFRLKSVQLHEAAVARLREQQKDEETRLEEQRRYRAVPLAADMLLGPTFTPLLPPPDEVVTVPDDYFCKQSDERAARRATFEVATKQRLDREKKARQEADLAREIAEKARIRAEWKAKAFRAQPVPDFENIPPPARGPGLEITSPHTPRFASRRAQLSKDDTKPESLSGGETHDNPQLNIA